MVVIWIFCKKYGNGDHGWSGNTGSKTVSRSVANRSVWTAVPATAPFRESPTFRPRVSSKFRPRQFPDRGGGLWRNGGDGVGAAAM